MSLCEKKLRSNKKPLSLLNVLPSKMIQEHTFYSFIEGNYIKKNQAQKMFGQQPDFSILCCAHPEIYIDCSTNSFLHMLHFYAIKKIQSALPRYDSKSFIIHICRHAQFIARTTIRNIQLVMKQIPSLKYYQVGQQTRQHFCLPFGRKIGIRSGLWSSRCC